MTIAVELQFKQLRSSQKKVFFFLGGGLKGALLWIFSISLNSQNIYLCHRKAMNNGLFLLTILLLYQYAETVSKLVSLAADGQD